MIGLRNFSKLLDMTWSCGSGRAVLSPAKHKEVRKKIEGRENLMNVVGGQ